MRESVHAHERGKVRKTDEFDEFDCRGTRQKDKRKKEVTVEEAVTAALDAIEKREAQVHSFVTVDREGALKRAKEVQAKIDAEN